MTLSQTTSESASIVVPNTSVKGVHGDIRRSWDPDVVPTLGHAGGVQTLYEAFRHGAAMNPLGPCLGFRAVSTSGMATPFIYTSYSECLARVNALAAGLDELQLLSSTTRSDADYACLGLCMKNCMEWILAEQATYTVGGVTVPLYDTLDPATAAFILQQTQTKTVVCSRAELPKLCQAKSSDKTKMDCFTTVLLVDGVTKEAAQLAEQASLIVLSYAQVEAVGARVVAQNKDANKHHKPPSPLDLATFCYTSGTTGMPKGAMISHQNLITTMAGMQAVAGFTIQLYDRHVSYLPLAHIFERVVLNQVLSCGASVAFYRGEPQYLVEDWQACRPTIVAAVPRVMNKIYDKVGKPRTEKVLR